MVYIYMVYVIYIYTRYIKTIKYMVYVHAMILRRHMRKTPKKRRDHLGSPEITLPILAIFKRLEKVGLFPTWSTYYHISSYIYIRLHVTLDRIASLAFSFASFFFRSSCVTGFIQMSRETALPPFVQLCQSALCNNVNPGLINP